MIADYCSCFPTTFSRRGIIPGLVSPFHLPERACFRQLRRRLEKRAVEAAEGQAADNETG